MIMTEDFRKKIGSARMMHEEFAKTALNVIR